MATLTMQIQGMHCESCVDAVQEALLRFPGVTFASVGLGEARSRSRRRR